MYSCSALIFTQIYRCFVIYARSRRVIAFPFILWVANGVCGILQIWRTASAPETAGQNVLGDYVTAFFFITVVTNILVTGAPPFPLYSVA